MNLGLRVVWGGFAVLVVLAIVAFVQEGREQRRLAARRRAFFDAHDKLEPR